MKILVFGNSNADINVKPVDKIDPSVDTTFVDDFELTTGGNAMTAAVTLSRLGCECSLATALGGKAEYFSNFLFDRIRESGIDTSLVQRIEGYSSGCVIVLISSAGSRWFYYKKGVQEIMDLSEDVYNAVPEYDYVSIHGTFLMPTFDGQGTLRLLQRAKECGKTTFMDLTPDTSGKWLETIGCALEYCDYFMPSFLEAKGITGMDDPSSMAHELYKTGVKTVIIKLGEKGCYYLNADNEGLVPSFPIKAIDTTGAGDSFCAGFIYSIAHGASLTEALRFANAAGAVCCEHIGATGGIKNIDSVNELISRF